MNDVIRYFLLIITSLAPLSTMGQQFSHQGPPARIVELYTSEGCSSCPPADRSLSKLTESPGLWQDVIPLAFHVDYWNWLGWKDRFSKAEYSARQRALSANGNVRSVYTPGWVVDGAEWRGWFKGQGLPRQKSQPAPELTLDLANNQATVTFTKNGNWQANFALLGFNLQTAIKAGENRGKHLAHDFVVLDFQQQVSEKSIWQFTIPAALLNNQKLAVVSWITRPERFRPVQTVAGWIEK
ncbi:DUF1223 domain-containing protein [Spartinivicinus poritis]|uniref:DUF1223 domain-containing protein n=1 Tax=Spartinivicinus poritis TaxID=2994640 RepID=A0ABT5UGN2_9GAMM|nr:DUF1223 domain-containing protein [Spartinivicinus sp. A2-2]MDE1465543.1 DUF1223 domain-containing protein [Spartinivicinus sp. A2-2]